MSALTLIGDVHGKVNEYWKLVTHQVKGKSVQVGDFGFKEAHEWHRLNIDARQHKVLFGNHDYYPMLYAAHSLWDHKLEGDVLFVRGAHSVDRDERVEGVDWWPEEELSYLHCDRLLRSLLGEDVRVVVSHDCPQSVLRPLFGISGKSRTGQLLDAILEQHRPELWVFGHHHKSKNEVLDGVRFRCLAELEMMEL